MSKIFLKLFDALWLFCHECRKVPKICFDIFDDCWQFLTWPFPLALLRSLWSFPHFSKSSALWRETQSLSLLVLNCQGAAPVKISTGNMIDKYQRSPRNYHQHWCQLRGNRESPGTGQRKTLGKQGVFRPDFLPRATTTHETYLSVPVGFDRFPTGRAGQPRKMANLWRRANAGKPRALKCQDLTLCR